MERHEIKRITQGKFKNRSLIFHLLDDRNNFEFLVSNVNMKSFNLRLVMLNLIYLSQIYETNNMFSCSNYRAKKDQPACHSVFTVKVSEPIQNLIKGDERKEGTSQKKKFKLMDFTNAALYDTNNYQLVCQTCPKNCFKHKHISFCSDHQQVQGLIEFKFVREGP